MMASLPIALPLLLLQAATLTPATVPATGHQEVVLTLDAPGALHLSARSPGGTACELVDRVRGPFAQNGTAGRTNCELDLLLDAGQYKVRLDSAQKGKGQVQLVATPFVELNQAPVRLVPGSQVVTTLKLQQQASYWLSLAARAAPFVHIVGRNAGDVRLWRNGEWLEPQALRHQVISPAPGQPMHEWWLDGALEAGEYKVVIAGREPTAVTQEGGNESLTVETGFRPSPPELALRFTLPASGVTSVMVPPQSLFTVLSLDQSPPGPVAMEFAQFGDLGPLSRFAACSVYKGALVPQCSGSVSKTEGQRALIITGPPGTSGLAEWVPRFENNPVAFGYYGNGARLRFEGAPGRFIVGVHDLPADADAPPLGCQLEHYDSNGALKSIVGHDAVKLDESTQLDREFNYDESGESLWFDITNTSRYRVKTTGGRKNHCELSKLLDDGTLKRLTDSKPDVVGCDEAFFLMPGRYQLSLSGGLTGVEHVIVKKDWATPSGNALPHVGCLLPDVTLENGSYALVLTRPSTDVRGLVIHRLPLVLDRPVHLLLEAKTTLELPLTGAVAGLVRSAGGAAFECTPEGASVSKGPECTLGTAKKVKLTNPGATPIAVTLAQSSTPPTWGSLVAHQPKPVPLPHASMETPSWFDFDRRESHSVIFDVEASGLYQLTTQGLLSTQCTLRTPVIDSVAQDTGSGRGRNCLVQTYLQKGRYLFTAQTEGQSRGRGALFISRKNARDFGTVAAEGESYFRVDANELVQQKLTVPASATYQLDTTAQGATLSCRLDDAQGWPLERVPTNCSGTRPLTPGSWLWTQLPLTVESMRHTKLSRVREEAVLSGNKVHPLEFFTWYRATLGDDGKDEFSFALSGESQLDVVLTNGMQGRIFRVEADKALRAVEIIPALAETQPEEAAPEADGAPPEYEGGRGMAEGEGDGEGSSDGNADTTPAPPRADRAPPPPSGVKVKLGAGQYKLVTEHSRGDVNLEYRVHLGTEALLPGMTRTLPVPSTVGVIIPKDGTLRLRTEGEADVRCRLFDEKGALVLQGSDNGADWNCAIAEPVRAGRYTLVLEVETLTRGETRVSLAVPPAEDKGPVVDGAKLPLGASVTTLHLPTPEKDAVLEVGFHGVGKTPFSCAVEDETGTILARRLRSTDCAFLVRAQTRPFAVRLWTTDGATSVTASSKWKPVIAGAPGTVEGDQALAVTLAHAGRYRTSGGSFCIGAADTGVLRPCGPEYSLEAGGTVFAVFGTRSQPLPLEESRAPAQDAAVVMPLGRRALVQTVTATAPSVFLMRASVPWGEKTSPACAFDGAGAVNERRERECFAASRVGTEASARVWTPSDSGVDAQLVRRAVAMPARADALHVGREHLTFSSGVGLYAAPTSGQSRLEVTLPATGWAVLLDGTDAAVDLCAPTGALHRCVLTTQGGRLLVVASEGQAEVRTLLLETPVQTARFTGLYEETVRAPGSLRLTISPDEADRQVAVEGAPRCTLVLSSGERLSGCRLPVPRRTSGELLLETEPGPVRALLYAPGKERQARLALELPLVPGPSLSAGVSVALQQGRVDRSLVLATSAVVRISAESGVCGLYRGAELLTVDGLDNGCELVRVLAPGTYRLLVRPFAGHPSTGQLKWTTEPVVALNEGVGAEDWLAPGEVKLYRFELQARGKVGLGLKSTSEAFECGIWSEGWQSLGEGCQEYLTLEKGSYLLTVRNPARSGAQPFAYQPVIFGLSGDKTEIPETFLNDFFRRIGETP
jgi:hypothetical protein